MVGTFRQEAMVIALAAPEAAPEALGAQGAEEESLGLDDPHGRTLSGRGTGVPRRLSVGKEEARFLTDQMMAPSFQPSPRITNTAATAPDDCALE